VFELDSRGRGRIEEVLGPGFILEDKQLMVSQPVESLRRLGSLWRQLGHAGEQFQGLGGIADHEISLRPLQIDFGNESRVQAVLEHYLQLVQAQPRLSKMV